ncbi:transposase, partial [Halonatronum saccharophilum]
SIYTTNWIERTNKEIRKRTKTTNSLPNLEAAEKLIYLQVNHYNEKWSNRIMKGYKIAQEKLQQFFEERYQ